MEVCCHVELNQKIRDIIDVDKDSLIQINFDEFYDCLKRTNF